MKVVSIIILVIFLYCCANNNSKEYIAQSVHTNDEVNSATKPIDTKSRIKEIREIIKKVGFIELPYKAIYPTIPSKTNIFDRPVDYEGILDDFYGAHNEILGILPDTTHFFAILYINLETTEVPNLIIFDMQGLLIDRKRITEENSWLFPGDIIKCEEYTTIEKDLTLRYYFMLIHDYESTDNNDEDVRYRRHEEGLKDSMSYKRYMYHYEKNGRITSAGKIEFDKLNKIKVKEVVKIDNK